MIPWIEIDSAPIPDGEETLRLKRRGTEFSIMLGSNELMNSRLSGSEEALARLCGEKLRTIRSPNVLIGGLGMGFTLRAMLAEVSEDASVVVSELVPAVVAWARGPMAEIFGSSLADPRVDVRESDVGGLISSGRATYDAILLDVDNGPEGLTRPGNDRLYDERGLHAAKHALRPGGVLAVWSSGPNPGFSKRLVRTGFRVEEVKARANGRRKGARHIIWLATAGGSQNAAQHRRG